jgi:predicted regulator of Ras-like GTPase activity (Roadblock/LC7/MglB family)
MQAIPIVTMEAAEQLLHALEDFLDESDAAFGIVIDRGGSMLSQAGKVPDNLDTTIVAALAAGSFAATKELAHRVGEEEFTALHQQGKQQQILMCGVDDDVVLVIVFDNQTTLGLVRFYSTRVVKRIAGILADLRENQNVETAFTLSDVNGIANPCGN